MQGGWIKLWRKLLESDMYRQLNSKQRDVMIACLLRANHKGKEWEWKGEIFHAEPGQFITSLPSLKEICADDVSIQNIRTALDKLERWGFLTDESTKTGRLITIVNWRVYQDEDASANRPTNRQLTDRVKSAINVVVTRENIILSQKQVLKMVEKLTDKLTDMFQAETPTNKEIAEVVEHELTDKLTDNQQTANRQLTANKNDIRMIKNDQQHLEGDDDFWERVQQIIFNTFGTLPNQIQIEVIESFLDDGLTEWHILDALRRTAEANARSFAYTKAILNNWLNQGLDTEEKVMRSDAQRRTDDKEDPMLMQQMKDFERLKQFREDAQHG